MNKLSPMKDCNSSKSQANTTGRTLRSFWTQILTPLSLHTSMKSINGEIEGSGLASNYYGSYRINKSININNKKKGENKTQNEKHTNTQNKQQLTKRCFGMLVLMSMVCGACAYDPAEDEEFNIQTKHIQVMEVSDELVISQNMAHIEKLILHKGAVVRTHGNNVTLRIKELVSDDAVFDTTPNPDIAPYGQVAQSGGILRIFAESAHGSLQILSHGQNGAKGKKGASGARGATGGRGHDAETDRERECWMLSPTSSILFEREPRMPCTWRYFCKRHAGNGGQGHRGNTGAAGENGSKGGDTAAFLVDVATPQNFRVTYEQTVGLGGVGGLGGEGGEGGSGGDAGRGTKECGNASNGSQGPSGDQGPQGQNGPHGSEQPLCLRLGQTEIGNCREFDDLTRRGAP